MSKLLVRVTDRQLLFRLWFCTARHFGEVNVDYVTTGAKTGLKGHKFVKLLWNWKSYLEVQFPPFLPPPPPTCTPPLNPISIPLGCCCGCRNIPSPLANYCPDRTCDLRQEESSLQALVLGRGGLVSCQLPFFFAQFDIPRPSENGLHLYSSHTQELHNVGQRQM